MSEYNNWYPSSLKAVFSSNHFSTALKSDEPRNLDNFAAVSCRISRAGPRNLAKFSAENCGS